MEMNSYIDLLIGLVMAIGAWWCKTQHEAKACINHINSLDQEIASNDFNGVQLRVGREAFVERLKAELEAE